MEAQEPSAGSEPHVRNVANVDEESCLLKPRSSKAAASSSKSLSRRGWPRCHVCGEWAKPERLLSCASCGVTVHPECFLPADCAVALSQQGASTFSCHACIAGIQTSAERCALCDRSGGALIRTAGGEWVHGVCAHFMPGVSLVPAKGCFVASGVRAALVYAMTVQRTPSVLGGAAGRRSCTLATQTAPRMLDGAAAKSSSPRAPPDAAPAARAAAARPPAARVARSPARARPGVNVNARPGGDAALVLAEGHQPCPKDARCVRPARHRGICRLVEGGPSALFDGARAASELELTTMQAGAPSVVAPPLHRAEEEAEDSEVEVEVEIEIQSEVEVEVEAETHEEVEVEVEAVAAAEAMVDDAKLGNVTQLGADDVDDAAAAAAAASSSRVVLGTRGSTSASALLPSGAGAVSVIDAAPPPLIPFATATGPPKCAVCGGVRGLVRCGATCGNVPSCPLFVHPSCGLESNLKLGSCAHFGAEYFWILCPSHCKAKDARDRYGPRAPRHPGRERADAQREAQREAVKDAQRAAKAAAKRAATLAEKASRLAGVEGGAAEAAEAAERAERAARKAERVKVRALEEWERAARSHSKKGRGADGEGQGAVAGSGGAVTGAAPAPAAAQVEAMEDEAANEQHRVEKEERRRGRAMAAAEAAAEAALNTAQAAVFAAPLPAAALALIGREAMKVQEAARAAAELKVGLEAATEASEAMEAMEAMAAPRAPQQLREYVASEDETVRQIAPDCARLRQIATDCARLRRIATDCDGLRWIATDCD